VVVVGTGLFGGGQLCVAVWRPLWEWEGNNQQRGQLQYKRNRTTLGMSWGGDCDGTCYLCPASQMKSTL